MTDAADPLDGLAETLDRAAVATVAQMFCGLSPGTLGQSFADWGLHLAMSPGKRLQLAAKAGRKWMRFVDYASRSLGDPVAEAAIEPLPQDRRFDDPAWRSPPYSWMSQAFLLSQQWWHAAMSSVGGVSLHHEQVVEFTTRQMLDVVAPTNFLATNPVLQRRVLETSGACLLKGASNLMEDLQRAARGEQAAGTDAFAVGKKVAVTPGKVVYRNRLIELIQYEAATKTVRPEPVLITPAWIMKYYILDLSPENSLVRWLTRQGFTVFMISWRNPTSADRELDLGDYRTLGPMAALDAITAITGATSVHGLGYCLGGTLMVIAAAAMARDDDHRLASLTLLAAQTEFSEPGELGLFIDDAQLNLLENMMWSRGYLDSAQMGGAFQLLRSNDLIWSRLLGEYLMGEREPVTDLMAWNADGTRMPYAMHSQYLRQLFLDNDLAEGRFEVSGKPVALSALQTPIFMVGTEWDHVAPWQSVYKLHYLTDGEIRFVLTSGGHNAGIVSEPNHAGRHFRVLTRSSHAAALSLDDWMERAEVKDGSWWIDWGAWLGAHSGPAVASPPLGCPDKGYPVLGEAPGGYVLER